MSSISRVFKGSRALMAAAKAATPKPSAPKKTPAPKSSSPKPRSSSSTTTKQPPKPGRLTGIMKLAPVSPALHKFLGVPEISRSDAVKKIWDYVKLHNLQNPANKREIYCDDKLKTIFEGKDKVGFLEIGRFVSLHFVKTN